MRIKILVAIVLLPLLYCPSYSQKSETIDRLTAKRFPDDKYLLVIFDKIKKTFSYKPLNKVETPSPLPSYFSYGETGVTFEIQAEFVSPFEYSLTLSSKETDDPNLKVISDFFDTAQANLPAGTLGAARAKGSSGAGTHIPVLLPEWLFLLQNTQSTLAGYPANYYQTMAGKFANVENYLYGEFATSVSAQATFETHITASAKLLQTAPTGLDFETRLATANQLYSDLKSVLDTKIKEELKAVKESMNTPNGFTYTASFNDYTKYSLGKLDNLVADAIKPKEVVLEKFRLLLAELKKVKLKEGRILLTVDPLEFHKGKDLSVSLKATPVEFNEKELKLVEQTGTESTFTIIRKRPQVEVSAGIAYFATRMTYNNYSLVGDSVAGNAPVQRISNAETRKYVIPVVFLNFYNYSIKKDTYWIFPQIGVGSGKEFPTFLFGAGFVIPGRLIVSTGLANTITQELKDQYKVDQVVDNSIKVEDTYEYRWKPDLYFSLQYKF